MTPLFVTGIGTGIGKTLVSAILAEALGADYWKPVQAGIEGQTDSAWIGSMLTNTKSIIHPEAYKLRMPASPHIAARQENIKIDMENIQICFNQIRNPQRFLIIEGAGGLLVPLNEQLFIIDLIKNLQADVI